MYYNPRHKNVEKLIMHNKVQLGKWRWIEAQLYEELREWTLANVRFGVPRNKTLSTQSVLVMKLVTAGVPLEHCHLLREWYFRNIAIEPRKIEYQKHDNNAEFVKLWVQTNITDVFYYQELKTSLVTGMLTIKKCRLKRVGSTCTIEIGLFTS